MCEIYRQGLAIVSDSLPFTILGYFYKIMYVHIEKLYGNLQIVIEEMVLFLFFYSLS